MTGELRAVLFDSGGVLIRPVGGRWNPRVDFEETILRHDPTVTPDRFAAAIAAGEDFFAASPSTPDYDDYHRVLLRHLGLERTPRLLAELSRELPVPSLLELYQDVPATLEELKRRGVRMAVVSDAWPGLAEAHDELGLGGYFEAYAISAVLGCRKPDPRMYRHASEALGLRAGECVFVDDDPELVAAAIELGYAGRALCRDGVAGPGVPTITALPEILDLFLS
ncbi:HAD family hydrolase [Streptomyces sp. NBC_00847]|uniref:HAD family hydrolase n=1 Tax=Streptomyces sp. NBC_00847 TaxID=2975850 RepID=UPI002259D218|nr:HAD-IA family hydrolase [Streptomyces sp. NBC_00847]MCX4880952.1 HAD-IA family hydrolase [Streptomyces sp. NBC_00847]